MMKLNAHVYDNLKSVKWFSQVGAGTADIDSQFQLTRSPSWNLAVDSLLSDHWQDARTEAQGDLTGHLAKYHPSHYGGHWNDLARQSRSIVVADIMPLVHAALQDRQPNVSVLNTIQLDINRIALWSHYRALFASVPSFFGAMFTVYQNGFLPCGWEGQLTKWPHGRLIVF